MVKEAKNWPGGHSLTDQEWEKLGQHIFDVIKHGDDEHQTWLRDKLEIIFNVSIIP